MELNNFISTEVIMTMCVLCIRNVLCFDKASPSTLRIQNLV